MKFLIQCFCITATCFGFIPCESSEPKISVKNRILTTVNGNAISVIDVMKKMDVLLHQNYPQFADSPQARFQFYASSWRSILMEMIDTELILSDAEDREIKLTDGEIREEMHERFGPSVQATLEKIGLSYDDGWTMIRKELITRKMMWFFAQAKALQSVTPNAIREAYRSHLAQNPPYQEWKYRVITLKADDQAKRLASEVQEFLQKTDKSLDSALTDLQEWEKNHPEAKLIVSNEYTAKESDLSDSHRSALLLLEPGSYSDPIFQMSRVEKKPVHRIFYLADKADHPAPSFEEMEPQVKNDLTQKAVAKENEHYLSKLRKHYGFDDKNLKETLPENLQPFALE